MGTAHTQRARIKAPPPSARAAACRISSPAADWISDNLPGGAVVKEKFMGGSNWASTYVYTTEGGQE